jgi:hypothetical protein
MTCFPRGHSFSTPGLGAKFFVLFFLPLSIAAVAQSGISTGSHVFYIDCSSSAAGDGSQTHPWNSLAAAQSHPFTAGDRIALARGATCHGSFSPQGSGNKDNPIRLTAYGRGLRPRIVAAATDRQVLLLFNQEHWQIDSLDLSGANKYGIFVSGDHGTLHGISLKNLYVHDVQGGELKNKDNGLVIVGPSGPNTFFDDILVDGVIAAHTNQWAGILVGGGNYGYKDDSPLNTHVTVRNSSVQDVFGDGIVLFRVSNGLIETSTAWQTGMQPTETTGTPNAIWTWTCTDCVVRDNEAFLTDSPGVDGGAYDIDWNNTRNTIERNYAHDPQGYCFAVFAAGYVTRDSAVRDNLCINNGLSPRLAALQGAAYLHGWNGGVIHGLRMEHNTFLWNPPVSSAAAVISDADFGDGSAVFAGNRIESSSQFFYRTNRQFAPAGNTYLYSGQGIARFTLGDRHEATLAALQSAGVETGTTLATLGIAHRSAIFLRMDATVDCTLDTDGLLASGARAQLMVLRSQAAQYGPAAMVVTAHLRTPTGASAEDAISNALLDLDANSIQFDRDAKQPGLIQLLEADGSLIHSWQGFQNAATLGLAVRAQLGVPRYAEMPRKMAAEDIQ